MNNLPIEIINKIQFMACGPTSLKIYKNHKKVCKELLKNDFYLYINNGNVKPELYITFDDYFFAKRIPRLIFGDDN